MESLPPEILIYIFSFIALEERLKVKLVCKTWRDICQDQLLLKRLNFSNVKGKGVDDKSLELILRWSTKVSHLNIFNCFQLSGKSLRLASFLGKFNTLKSLNISWTNINNSCLIEVLKTAHNLKNLDLFESTITDKIVPYICNFAGHSLEFIRLPGSNCWKEGPILNILKSCENLRAIDFILKLFLVYCEEAWDTLYLSTVLSTTKTFTRNNGRFDLTRKVLSPSSSRWISDFGKFN